MCTFIWWMILSKESNRRIQKTKLLTKNTGENFQWIEYCVVSPQGFRLWRQVAYKAALLSLMYRVGFWKAPAVLCVCCLTPWGQRLVLKKFWAQGLWNISLWRMQLKGLKTGTPQGRISNEKNIFKISVLK